MTVDFKVGDTVEYQHISPYPGELPFPRMRVLVTRRFDIFFDGQKGRMKQTPMGFAREVLRVVKPGPTERLTLDLEIAPNVASAEKIRQVISVLEGVVSVT